MSLDELPRRGPPVRELDLPLPGDPVAAPGMPIVRGRRPLKRWRYVGVYGPELMLCAGDARIGPVPQRWWAVLERGQQLRERSTAGRAGMRLDADALRIESRGVRVELRLEPESDHGAVESVSPSGPRGYVWTRKQAGVPARGHVEIDGRRRSVECEAVIDETAGYHERRTMWRWSAGVGRAESGERVGWNLVSGVNDDPSGSERTLWIDGEPSEVGPAHFAADLSEVSFPGGGLTFSEWDTREHERNLLLLRSSYRQPFGEFRGRLPGDLRLAAGYGVMEWHDARW